MNTERLNIPKKIHVGFQERSDTYTGKLAYVIYTDQKGIRRKEKSWLSWKNDKLATEDYDNEPTTGFVLNKGVGGARHSYGRNARNEYIRIYDPRGFEFEISVANLLFILTETSSIKGKGLEGEFVYSWSGSDLVLLPTSSLDYNSSVNFSSLQALKVNKKDIKEGRTYLFKDTEEAVYLGNHVIRSNAYQYSYYPPRLCSFIYSPDKAVKVFYLLNSKEYRFETGFNRLASIVNEDSHPEYANFYSDFTNSIYVSKFSQIVLTSISSNKAIKDKEYSKSAIFIKQDNDYQLVHISYNESSPYLPITMKKYNMTDKFFFPIHKRMYSKKQIININSLSLIKTDDFYTYRMNDESQVVSDDYLKDKELFVPEIELESKIRIGISGYVQRRKN